MRNIDYYNGIPVIVIPKIQIRKHRKKRINKKWAKRYGFYRNRMEDGEIVMVFGKLIMNSKTFEDIKAKVC